MRYTEAVLKVEKMLDNIEHGDAFIDCCEALGTVFFVVLQRKRDKIDGKDIITDTPLSHLVSDIAKALNRYESESLELTAEQEKKNEGKL